MNKNIKLDRASICAEMVKLVNNSYSGQNLISNYGEEPLRIIVI